MIEGDERKWSSFMQTFAYVPKTIFNMLRHMEDLRYISDITYPLPIKYIGIIDQNSLELIYIWFRLKVYYSNKRLSKWIYYRAVTFQNDFILLSINTNTKSNWNQTMKNEYEMNDISSFPIWIYSPHLLDHTYVYSIQYEYMRSHMWSKYAAHSIFAVEINRVQLGVDSRLDQTRYFDNRK